MDIIALLSDPAAWLALLTLIALEVILGVDNLIFIAILSNKLPQHQQSKARRIGLALALIMRIGLLMLIGWIVTLQTPLFDLGITGTPGFLINGRVLSGSQPIEAFEVVINEELELKGLKVPVKKTAEQPADSTDEVATE